MRQHNHNQIHITDTMSRHRHTHAIHNIGVSLGSPWNVRMRTPWADHHHSEALRLLAPRLQDTVSAIGEGDGIIQITLDLPRVAVVEDGIPLTTLDLPHQDEVGADPTALGVVPSSAKRRRNWRRSKSLGTRRNLSGLQ